MSLRWMISSWPKQLVVINTWFTVILIMSSGQPWIVRECFDVAVLVDVAVVVRQVNEAYVLCLMILIVYQRAVNDIDWFILIWFYVVAASSSSAIAWPLRLIYSIIRLYDYWLVRQAYSDALEVGGVDVLLVYRGD